MDRDQQYAENQKKQFDIAAMRRASWHNNYIFFLGYSPFIRLLSRINEPISKVCCCRSGENLNPVFSALFWAPTFAGVTLFNRFEISSNVFTFSYRQGTRVMKSMDRA
jgi:hypothetical protein